MTPPLALTHPLPPRAPAPQPADIEWLAQYALSRTGNLPWARGRDRELAFDRGLTVNLDRGSMVTWGLAEVCAGIQLGGGRPLPARMTPDDDTITIIEAIKALGPKTASTIIECARAKIRPEWRVSGHAEAQLIIREQVYGKKKKGKHWKRVGRPRTIQIWDPSEEAICAAREVYSRWHAGLLVLSSRLFGRLSRFQTNGLAAPERPWEIPLQKIA
jgi:hypothetical protein